MFGRYRYIRVSMGTSLSNDCFLYKMDQIFGPIEQCCGIADNLVMYGYTLGDHDRVLFTVLDTAKQVGLKLNPDKCSFRCMQIPFFGMLIGADGIRPDHRKLKLLIGYLYQAMYMRCNHS